MNEVAFSFQVTSPERHPRTGRIVLAQLWRDELGSADLMPGEDFRIVILAHKPSTEPTVETPAVAVCIPASTPAASKTLREAQAAYQSGFTAPLRLPRSLLTALSRGHILTSGPLDLQPQQIFLTKGADVSLDLLAQALIAQREQWIATAEVQIYLQTLAAALHLPLGAYDDERSVNALLETLRDTLEAAIQAVDSLALQGEAAEELSSIAARLRRLSAAGDVAAFREVTDSIYRGVLDLAEDAFFCRALQSDPSATLDMVSMKWLVAKAKVPPSSHELYTDWVAQREDLTFAIIVEQPHSFASVSSRFELFGHRYQRAYLAHHQRYWQEASLLLRQLQEAGPKLEALVRLNTLWYLGPPLGEEVRSAYPELLAATSGCPLEGRLESVLTHAPTCPSCGIELADEPPRQGVQDLVQTLAAALSNQLQRLSTEAVRRILSRRGEGRLAQFLQVVQASDLSGLANILDDPLLEFLRRLISEASLRVPLAPVLAELAHSYPEVAEDDVEEVSQELARRIQAALRAARGEPEPPPTSSALDP